MHISIVIVNYNTPDLTSACIDSIRLHTRDIPYEIILVDNCSTKGNPDDFLKKFPDIKLIKNPVNEGFAKGNNLGIRHASGDVILLLNSDTLLHEDSISQAALYMQKEQAVMLTVKLIYQNGRYQHNARRFRNLFLELLDLFRPFLLVLSYRKRAALMLNQHFHGDFNVCCDWISGAFMMFPRSILERFQDGQLDERFFMYGEDQLWCCQLAPEGNGCHFFSETTVTHLERASADPRKRFALFKKQVELELYIMKYRRGDGVYYRLFKTIFYLKESARYFIKVLFRFN